jgi:two-component system sensor histidine kinase UhpB
MDPQAATRGLGLLGCTERAAAVGGTLQVVSSPGAGCAMRFELPLAALGGVEAAGSAMKEAA